MKTSNEFDKEVKRNATIVALTNIATVILGICLGTLIYLTYIR